MPVRAAMEDPILTVRHHRRRNQCLHTWADVPTSVITPALPVVIDVGHGHLSAAVTTRRGELRFHRDCHIVLAERDSDDLAPTKNACTNATVLPRNRAAPPRLTAAQLAQGIRSSASAAHAGNGARARFFHTYEFMLFDFFNSTGS